MLRFVLICSLLAVGSRAHCSSQNTILLGGGIFTPRGILGLSYERILQENHSLVVTLGADIIGLSSSLGYRFTFGELALGETYNDKCMFFFDCDSRYYVGPSIQYAKNTSIEFSTNGITEATYSTGDKTLLVSAIGTKGLFKNGFTLETEITYRRRISQKQNVLTSGVAQKSHEKHLDFGQDTVGLSVGFGYSY